MKRILGLFRKQFIVVLEVNGHDVVLSQPTNAFVACHRYAELMDMNPNGNVYKVKSL